MIALLLAATLTFTAPSFDAARAGACLPDSIPVPCTDLDHFIVSGQRQGQKTPQFFQTIPGTGREGQSITFTPTPPDHPDDIWSIFVQSVDHAGNVSCWSNITSINGTVSVTPGPPPSDEEEEWYDIAGRRLHHRPTMPGIYFYRRGGVHRRVIIKH